MKQDIAFDRMIIEELPEVGELCGVKNIWAPPFNINLYEIPKTKIKPFLKLCNLSGATIWKRCDRAIIILSLI